MIANVFIIVKHIACILFLICGLFYCNASSAASQNQSSLTIYDGSRIIYVQDNDYLHIGIKKANSVFYPIFATVGTQQAAVKFLATKSMVINGIYIEAAIIGSNTQAGLPAKQSALILESRYSVKINKGLIVTAGANVSGYQGLNSEAAGIVIALPLSSNIINHGYIIGNYGIAFKKNGYLEGTITNYGDIVARTAIGATDTKINTTNNINIINDYKGFICGSIILDGANNKIENYGIIKSMSNSNFISKGVKSAINNSGTISLHNIIPSTIKNYLHLNNEGYIYTEKNLVVNSLYNKHNIIADSLAVLNEATNSKNIVVNKLCISNSITINNTNFKIQATRFTNLTTGNITIKQASLVVNDGVLSNQGAISIQNNLVLSGTLTNNGKIIARTLLADNKTLIVNQSATSFFYNLGASNSNIDIINYGNLTIGGHTQRTSDKVFISGNIAVHKDNSYNQDGVFNLSNNITQLEGTLNIGSIIAATETNLTIEDKATANFNTHFLDRNLTIHNKGVLQLESSSSINSYDGSSGLLIIKLNTNSIVDIINKKALLNCDSSFNIDKSAKIKIIPPKKITKDISTKLYTVYATKLVVVSLWLYTENFIEKNINGSTELYLTNMKAENGYLTGQVTIKSLIGYFPDTEYAKQELVFGKLSSMGVAWKCNKNNQQATSNNLIVSPNVLAMEAGQLNFDCTKKDLIVGSQTTKNKFSCNTKNSLPAILIGTTVATDDNFIASTITEPLSINSISLFNIEADGRNELGKTGNTRNKDAIVINGTHPLHLNGTDGLLLDQSMLIKAGATSCGLSIVASMTGNITNNTIIGDSLTGIAIGVNNYFKGSITNNGTLDATNYAIYVNPKKYGNVNIADFSINNINYINGSIYFDVNRSGITFVNLNNSGHIIANTITNKGDNPLHIINNKKGKIYATEISATIIQNFGNMDITGALFSNKFCKFLNQQSGVATITNMYLDKPLINDGQLFLTNLFSNNSTLTNNNVVNVGTITNINITNNNIVNIYKFISGKVNIANTSTNVLTIADIVITNKGTQLTTNGIQIANKAKLINSKNATINIKQPANLAINNNVDNYGTITVDSSIDFSSDFTNNGIIIANTITSTNGSCIYNQTANSLFCNNLGSNNAKLALVGNLNISNNATHTNILGNIQLHANNLRQYDGTITLGNNLQQLIVNGNFYLGGISSTPKAIDLVINKNSICDFSLPLKNNNLSVINSGTLELIQDSEINNYNSNNGQLSLSIIDVKNIKNGLLNVLNSATFDVSSVINLKYCDSNKLNEQTITVVQCAKLINKQSLANLVKSIKVGSILLTVTNTKVVNNNIITDISPTDFIIANPNITTASQLLYKNIVGSQVSITGKAWKIYKDSSGKLTTNNLIISPSALLEDKNIIDYDKKNKVLRIKSYGSKAVKIDTSVINNYPPLVIGTTVATDTNFIVINNNKLEFNSILIDHLFIDGSHNVNFQVHTDAIVINGDAPIHATLTIGYAATVTAGRSSSALRIIPSFDGKINNYGVIGSSFSNNGITLDNFLAGSLNNENKIIANNAALQLNVAKNQQNKNFVINNNGEIKGSIIIEATKITDNFIVTINNNKLISSNTITSNEKIYTTLNNMNNAELTVSYFNIDKVNNKGALHLQQKEYKISNKILTQSGEFCAKNIIIDGAFTNAGNMYVTSLSGTNYTKKIINNGLITTDSIANIIADNTGILKVKAQINGRVVVSNTVTMSGNVIITPQSSVTLGSLVGDNYQLINKGKAIIDNLIVDKLINVKNASLTVTDNLELTSNSDNYSSIEVKNLVIKSGTFTNKKNASLTLRNDKSFVIGDHNFNNKGTLYAGKIKIAKNFNNKGNIFTIDLIADAQQIINNPRCLLSWENIKANNDLDIINKGSLVFSPSKVSVISGTITIHKDSNKAQDGKLKILGNPYIYNKLTVGELEGSATNTTIYVQPSGKLTITLPFQQRNTLIENSGEISLCSGSDINSYTAKDKSSIYFNIRNIKQAWLHANLIQFHNGGFIYVTPEASFTLGSNNKVRIITSNSQILNIHEAGSKALLNSKNIKERILYFDKHNRILRLSNIKIADNNMSVMADIHVLDHSKTTHNMLYADQMLIPSLLGYPLATNIKEIVGVVWLTNFYKNTNNPQSNNLIISPVALLQDNQLQFDTTKKVLSIGLSKFKYSVKRIKSHPAIVIGNDVNPGGVFVKSSKGTKNLILDSIHINNIEIIAGTSSLIKSSTSSMYMPTFEDAVLITGNNNIKLTNSIGFVLGSNTNLTSNSGSCLNFATTFLGNINNFSSINAIRDARAIKINQFFEGTITNKNIIRAKNIAIEIKTENVKESFDDIKKDDLQHITIMNEATISGDISVNIQKKYDNTTFVNFFNKSYMFANKFSVLGNLELNIINNKSATLTIGVLDGYLSKINNYGCLQVASITDKFHLNDNTFSNYKVAKLGSCVVAGSLTNKSILYIENLTNIPESIIYNHNYLQLGNIYNSVNIGGSGTLVINGECVKGKINIDGTLTVNKQLKTLNKCYLSCKKIDLAGNIINNKGCTINVYSNLSINNNFINYGVLAVSGKLSLLDDFDNKGSIYVQYLIGNNRYIYILERQKIILNNIGASNNEIDIINNGSLTIKSVYQKTAKLQGNINIKDSEYLSFSNFILDGAIEQIDGVLFAKSFNSKENSAIAIKPQAIMIFTDSVQEKQVAINNQGFLGLAHNSVLKSYNSSGGCLSVAITTFENQIKNPLLLIEDIATFNKNSQIELKYLDKNISDKNTGMVVDILYAKKGLFNQDVKLKKLKADDIIKNITVSQVSSNIILSIDNISITNNAITAHISVHDISKLYGDLHPAAQKLMESPSKLEVYGIAWKKNKINNKFSNNNLIISPVNVAIDGTLIRFSTATNILQVGSYSGMKNIFVSNSEAALIIGNHILLDSFFTEINNLPVELDKINIDNIVIDGSIDDFDYSIISKDGVLINGNNGFILTNGFIVGSQAKIVAGASSTALNISTYLKSDITNNGIIGNNNTGYGVLIRNAINGSLANNGIITGKIAALNYDEYNKNNYISFNIVNSGTLIGSLLFNGNKTKNNTQEINLYNSKTIIAQEISATEYTNINIYNEEQATIIVDKLNVSLLKNEGLVKVTGKENFKINSNNFINNNKVVANNILLTGDFYHKGILQVNLLDGNHNAIKNNGYIQAKNIKNIKIENLSSVEVSASIDGSVIIDGKLKLSKNVIINKDSTLTSGYLFSNDKLINYGIVHINQDATISVLKNQKNSELQVENALVINDYSENYGKIIAKSVKCKQCKLSNLANGYIRITGEDGFIVDEKSFENNNNLLVDNKIIIQSDFINNGKIQAGSVHGHNVDFTINEECSAQFKNIANINRHLNIINKGRLIIGISGYDANIISGNILVVKDKTKSLNADIIAENNITQKSGVLHAGGLSTKTGIKYSINNDAITIFNNKISERIRFINSGVLAIRANSTIKEYHSDDGILILTLTSKDYGKTLLQASNNIYLTKNSKIIINSTGKVDKNIRKYTRVAILSAKKGIIYKDFNYKNNNFNDMIFAVSTNSVLLKTSNIVANSHAIYANILQLNATEFTNIGHANKILTKVLLGDCQQDESFLEGISWENIEEQFNHLVSKKIVVAPHELHNKYKLLNLTSSGIEVGHENTASKNNAGVLINFTNKQLSSYEIVSKYTQYLLDPLMYSQYPDLSQLFLQLKNRSMEASHNVTDKLLLPELFSGKVYSDFEETITIKNKINIRKSKKINANNDAVIITGDLDKSSTLKTINIESTAKLLTYATADALHIAIPSYANINNMGIVGDQQTGCGLKITKAISSTITNNNTISGKFAIVLDISKNIAEVSPQICVNNKGVIYGSLLANSSDKTQLVTLNNFNTIIAETITENKNSNISINNNKYSFMESDCVKLSNIYNCGLININNIYNCKNTINEGTINVDNKLFVGVSLVNKGVISSTSIIGKHNSAIVNDNKISTNKLENIVIDNKNNAIFTIKHSITGKVTITGGVHISGNISQKGYLVTDKIISENNSSCFNIQKNATCNLTKSIESSNLNIENHGYLNIQHGSTFNSYIANGGEITIQVPHDLKAINRSLLYIENTASFNTCKGNLSKILLSADIPLGYNQKDFVDNKKSLVKIITSKKMLFNGNKVDNEMENVLSMQAINSSSIFIRITNPYVSKEDGKEILYAFIGWEKISNAIDLNKYPISVKRLAVLMQEKQLTTDQQKIMDIVIDGISSKYLPKESENIVSYLLQDNKHTNIYNESISRIQKKFENCLTQQKSDLVKVVASLIPDTPSIDMNLDTSVATSILSTVNNNFIKNRLETSKATGVNSSPYYSKVPIWHSFSFVKTKENYTTECRYNKWVSHLLNVGFDDQLTKNITIGAIVSYAQTSISPINNNYNNNMRHLTSMLASCYLQYTSRKIQTNLVFILANNFHRGDYRYHIIDKEYHAQYTTKLYGGMLELAYPCQYNNVAIDLSTAVKVFSDRIPSNNLGLYEKHAKICFNKAEYSAAVSISQEFYAVNNIMVNYAVSAMYSYNINTNGHSICSNVLGKNFVFRVNNGDKNQITVDLNAGLNIKKRLNINCSITKTKQNHKSSLGATFTTKYLF